MAEEFDQLTDRELQEDIAKSLRLILELLEQFSNIYRTGGR